MAIVSRAGDQTAWQRSSTSNASLARYWGTARGHVRRGLSTTFEGADVILGVRVIGPLSGQIIADEAVGSQVREIQTGRGLDSPVFLVKLWV